MWRVVFAKGGTTLQQDLETEDQANRWAALAKANGYEIIEKIEVAKLITRKNKF